MSGEIKEPHLENRVNEGTYVSHFEIKVSTRLLLDNSFDRVAIGIKEQISTDIYGFVVAIVCPDSGESQIIPLRLKKEDSLSSYVIGRHECATISFLSDMRLSLRHLVLLLSNDPNKGPMARILDLRSEFGIVDANDVSHESIASNGAMAFRVGDSALFVLPGNTTIKEETESSGLDRVDWATPIPWIPDRSPEKQLKEEWEKTYASASVSMSGELSKRHQGMKDQNADDIAGTIRLEKNDRISSFPIEKATLRTGMLIGRYERCDINAGDFPMTERVSRVHALMIDIDDKIYLFDAGSTNGNLRDDVKIEKVNLSENPASVLLLGDMYFSWLPKF